MLKEAIEKIEELAKPIILDVDNRTYAVNKNGEAQEIIPEAVYQSCLSLNSLDALVQMVKTEGTCADRPDKLYLSVKDHMTVRASANPSTTCGMSVFSTTRRRQRTFPDGTAR